MLGVTGEGMVFKSMPSPLKFFGVIRISIFDRHMKMILFPKCTADFYLSESMWYLFCFDMPYFTSVALHTDLAIFFTFPDSYI